jgi:hypothetical protein
MEKYFKQVNSSMHLTNYQSVLGTLIEDSLISPP